MTDKYIFLDIDGVLNVGRENSSNHKRFSAVVDDFKYTLYLSPDHGDQLISLTRDTNSTIVWSSMWEEHANRVGMLIGLPHLDNLFFPNIRFADDPSRVKVQAAQDYAKGQPFVMFDDWYGFQDYMDDNQKFIWVNPDTGLTTSHISQAKSFLSQF
jgi:hypothetical protein